ncbi:tyrosine-type recombinase/integrase [Magnetococcales bacterium HHB-1]
MNKIPVITEYSPVDTLPDQVQDYIRSSISDRTRKEYQDDLRRFLNWGGKIPSSPEEIALYLSAHANTHKAATLERWKVSIGKAHVTQGYEDHGKSILVHTTLKGIRRRHGTAQRRVAPALKEDIISMVSGLGHDRLKDIRDRALLLIGFAGAFRRSELVALDVEDVVENKEGLVITIRQSKTDQDGKGQAIGVPYARGIHCPVKAYQLWLESARISSGAIFRGINRHGHLGKRLHPHSVAYIIKDHAKRVGLDPRNYSGHSLRAGLATSAAKDGVPVHKICNQTRHKSSRMLDRYIRDGQLFDDNAAGIL